MSYLPEDQHYAIGLRGSAINTVYGAIWRVTVGGCIVVTLDACLGWVM